MATNVNLPPGFVLDEDKTNATLPPGFVLDSEEKNPWTSGAGQGKATGIQQAPPLWKELTGQASRIGMPIAGSVGGALAGAPLGPLGAIGGGVLGYMGGSYGADATQEAIGLNAPTTLGEAVSKLPQYATEAAMQEITGPLFGKIVGAPKALFKFAEKKAFSKYPSLEGFKNKMPSLAPDTIMERAGQRLLETETPKEPFLTNIKEANKLESEIPGLKFTRAQKSQNPMSITQERALPRTYPQASLAWKEQRAQSNQAIRDYFKQNFPEQEGVDQFLSGIESKQTSLASGLEAAKGKREAELLKIQPKTTEQGVGRSIRGLAEQGKRSTYATAQELYRQVPNVKLSGNDIVNKINQIEGEFVQSGNAPSDFPATIINQMKTVLDPDAALKSNMGQEEFMRLQTNPKLKAAIQKGLGLEEVGGVDFQQIRGFQSQIRQAQEDAARGGNYQLSRRLTELGETVRESIERQLKSQGEEVWTPYQKAQEFYNKYDKTFRKGAVGNILERGDLPNSKKIADMDVAGEFFHAGRLDEADAFTEAFGNNAEARNAIKDYASYDLMKSSTNPQTGEIDGKKLARWMFKNKSVLQKFNLEKDFVGVTGAQKAVDSAAKEMATYEKSAFARALNADPEKVMNSLFTGSGGLQSAQRAKELLKLTENNPEARSGLKKSFADFVFHKMERTELDIMQNPEIKVDTASKTIEKYLPAMRELYKDEPQKLMALLKMQQAYRTLQRNVASPLGGGSDTAENFFTALTQEAAPLITTRYRWVSAFKAIAQKLDKYTKDQQNAYLTRAMVDDEIAETLRDMARGAYKTPNEINFLGKKVEGQLSRMFASGAIGTIKSIKEIEDRKTESELVQ